MKAWMTLVAVALVPAAMAQVGSTPPAVGVQQPIGEQRVQEAPRSATNALATQQTVMTPGQGVGVPGLGGPLGAVQPAGSANNSEFAEAGFGNPLVQLPPPARRVPAPPAQLTLESGKNRTFGVALTHINRIGTPFSKAKVVTSSDAGIQSVSGVLYVSTNNTREIGLFIHEENDPSRVISLTLVPGEMEPVSTEINLQGQRSDAVAQPKYAADPNVAQRFETSQSYVESLTSVVTQLAYGRLPDGYGMESVTERNAGSVPQCRIAGMSLVPKQIITGGELFAVVYAARAITTAVVEEESCSEEARAGAAWPLRALRAGERTEVFAVFARADDADSASLRPSVIGGGAP